MGSKLIGRTLPGQVTCEDAEIDMSRDESVLILIDHCRDMKQQETRLRLITLLLVFGCTALFIFNICTDLFQRETPGASGQERAAGQSPAFSKQDRVPPADNRTNSQRLCINLKSESEINGPDGVYMRWTGGSDEEYNKEKRAIVIPEDGFYFVYVQIALSCPDEKEASGFMSFYTALHVWNEAYNQSRLLMDALDGLTCSEGFRNLFVGQICDLLKGDHVNVWISEGYKLIKKSDFGAYLT